MVFSWLKFIEIRIISSGVLFNSCSYFFSSRLLLLNPTPILLTVPVRLLSAMASTASPSASPSAALGLKFFERAKTMRIYQRRQNEPRTNLRGDLRLSSHNGVGDGGVLVTGQFPSTYLDPLSLGLLRLRGSRLTSLRLKPDSKESGLETGLGYEV